jgi:hypothetical protein
MINHDVKGGQVELRIAGGGLRGRGEPQKPQKSPGNLPLRKKTVIKDIHRLPR